MKVVILAVTRMHEDRICIAGINEDNQWVRPVKVYPQSMDITDIFDKNTKKPIYEMFNIVDIPVIRKEGNPPHTEDVLIDSMKNPQVIGKIHTSGQEAFLVKHCENELFKGHSLEDASKNPDSHQYKQISDLLIEANRSLILVGPAKLHRAVLKIDKTPRLDFDIPGYPDARSRPCTDLNFIALCKRLLEENNAQEITLESPQLANILKTDKIFLGLGLSRKFKGAFHTMIIGLYPIHDHESEGDSKNSLIKLLEKDGYVYIGNTEKMKLYDLKKQGISLVNVCMNEFVYYDVPINDLLKFTKAKSTFFNKYFKKDISVKREAIYKPKDRDMTVTDDERKGQTAEYSDTAFIILRLIKYLDFHAGRKLLAEILIGSKSKKIEHIIGQMIAKEYLIKKRSSSNYSSNYSKPLFYLTELAERALDEKIAIDLRLPVKNESFEYGDLGILNELKAWRKNIASKENIPAFCVFHDSTLINIANKKPKNMEELKKIKGIGVIKIKSYGDKILNIVNGCNK